MHSCIYRGEVRHERFSPVAHRFGQRLFMMYLDLAEVPALFDRRWCWSARGRALAEFRRSDYLGAPDVSLDAAVRELLAARALATDGPVRMLTHLRYFGHCFNPVSFYYCFQEGATEPRTVIAQITNTPWRDRHEYVLPRGAALAANAGSLHFRFDKRFHVSPFMAPDVVYDWHLGTPARRLQIGMCAHAADGGPLFAASLDLEREPITRRNLAAVLLQFPLMTLQVVGGIYLQALRLALKRAPFFSHPSQGLYSSNHGGGGTAAGCAGREGCLPRVRGSAR